MLAWQAVSQLSYLQSPGLRLGRSPASLYDVMLLISCGHGALQSSSDITYMGFCPTGHIPSKWQNMSVHFGHGTMTCPSSVHLCPPSTRHLFILSHLHWGFPAAQGHGSVHTTQSHYYGAGNSHGGGQPSANQLGEIRPHTSEGAGRHEDGFHLGNR